MFGALYDSAVADAVIHLRAWRVRAGIPSPYALAKRAGVSLTTVLRLESGETGGVDFGVLGKLAGVLAVEPGDLFRPPPAA